VSENVLYPENQNKELSEYKNCRKLDADFNEKTWKGIPIQPGIQEMGQC